MSSPDTPLATAAMAQSRLGQAESSEHSRRGRARPDVDFVVGPRVSQATASRMYERETSDPVYRPLRIYALDPAASLGDGALAVVNVPYEPIECGPLGPRGAILEIIDDDLPQ